MRPAAALALLVLLLTVPASVAAADGAPLADAGLDQHAAVDRAVYLDAAGSSDPDGDIERYRWRVRSPDGARLDVECDSCAQTSFVPRRHGRYVATLTVTDDDGHDATDRLYAFVGVPAVYDTGGSRGPTLAVGGPPRLAAGTTARYRATATAGDAPLRAVTWRVDGRVVQRDAANGSVATVALDYAFANAGAHRVNATVTDRENVTAANATASTVTSAPRTAVLPGVADRALTVSGPRRLDAAAPVRATYRVDDPAAPAVTWYLDGDAVAEGPTATLSLDAGVHDLFVRWGREDSRGAFADNETRVVVDAGPVLDVSTLGGGDALALNATARDVGGDLVDLTLSVDGVPRASADGGGTERRLDGRFLLPAGEHTVVVRATDARGRTDAVARDVTVTTDCGIDTRTVPFEWPAGLPLCGV